MHSMARSTDREDVEGQKEEAVAPAQRLRQGQPRGLEARAGLGLVCRAVRHGFKVPRAVVWDPGRARRRRRQLFFQVSFLVLFRVSLWQA